jgi:membrane associated rhomboid family serine protease
VAISCLGPSRCHGEIWQLFTYSFVDDGLLGVLFGMLTLWFTELPPRALLRLPLARRTLPSPPSSAARIIASTISFTHIFGLRPEVAVAGCWSGIFGLLVAIAMIFGDQEFLLWFLVRIKAKYMVAIYILIAVAMLLKQADTFNALLQLSGALSAFLYVKFAPRRGFAFGFSERYFSLRNNYYRWKPAAPPTKFEVTTQNRAAKSTSTKTAPRRPDELRKPTDMDELPTQSAPSHLAPTLLRPSLPYRNILISEELCLVLPSSLLSPILLFLPSSALHAVHPEPSHFDRSARRECRKIRFLNTPSKPNNLLCVIPSASHNRTGCPILRSRIAKGGM